MSNSIYTSPLCSCIECKQSFSSKSIHSHYISLHTIDGNNVRKTCAKKSIQKTLDRIKLQNNTVRIQYTNNPNHCIECDCCIPYNKRYNKFCSSSCSAIYNNKKRCRNKHRIQKETKTIISKIKSYCKLYICKSCGNLHKSNNDKLNCNCGLSTKYQLLESLVKYFNFNKTTIGTNEVTNEYIKCKQYIQDLYCHNSLPSLCKLIGHNDAGNLGKIFKSMGISLDDLSSSQSKSYLQNRSNLPSSENTYYKSGWYSSKTGRSYYYRSSYELKFIELLEDNNIIFDMELPFKYYDTQREKFRTALPDFIFNGKIVEIKSEYTFDKINMIDKFKSYIDNGYNPTLQLEFKYYKLENDDFIEDLDFMV